MSEEMIDDDYPKRISLKLNLSSRHVELLKSLQERLGTRNAAETLRRLLELKSKGLLVRINSEVQKEILYLLDLPPVKDEIKLRGIDDFVQWSLIEVIPRLYDLIGTIEDPKVRLSLSKRQLLVASQLWRLTLMKEYKNGVTAKELSMRCNLSLSEVEKILDELEFLGLIEKKRIVGGGEITWGVILNR